MSTNPQYNEASGWTAAEHAAVALSKKVYQVSHGI
jgi:hypothetical protein